MEGLKLQNIWNNKESVLIQIYSIYTVKLNLFSNKPGIILMIYRTNITQEPKQNECELKNKLTTMLCQNELAGRNLQNCLKVLQEVSMASSNGSHITRLNFIKEALV